MAEFEFDTLVVGAITSQWEKLALDEGLTIHVSSNVPPGWGYKVSWSSISQIDLLGVTSQPIMRVENG